MKKIKSSDITRLRVQVMSLSRRFRREDRGDEGSWSRLLLLGAIERGGDNATPSSLAAGEGLRSSNLAAALRELERSGLITRTPDGKDQRKVRVGLTSEGKRLLVESRARREKWLAEAVEASLTKEECAILFAAGGLLERIATYSEND